MRQITPPIGRTKPEAHEKHHVNNQSHPPLNAGTTHPPRLALSKKRGRVSVDRLGEVYFFHPVSVFVSVSVSVSLSLFPSHSRSLSVARSSSFPFSLFHGSPSRNRRRNSFDRGVQRERHLAPESGRKPHRVLSRVCPSGAQTKLPLGNSRSRRKEGRGGGSGEWVSNTPRSIWSGWLFFRGNESTPPGASRLLSRANEAGQAVRKAARS